MNALQLLLLTVGISASGALAPGPLFLSTVVHGSRQGARAGLYSAMGHMAVELPYVLILALGFNLIIGSAFVKRAISLIGALALFSFSSLTVKEALMSPRGAKRDIPSRKAGSPLVSGMLFTGLNPYFLLWWSTAGAPLITSALLLASWLGIAYMYAAHVWMDFAFLYASAYFAGRGVARLSPGYLRWALLALSAIMFYIGLVFLLSSF